MALSQALKGEARSSKVRTGVMRALRRAARRPGVGLATMGSWQCWRSGRSGERVADVGEVVAEAGLEGGELVFAGEVELAVGGEDAGEEAEVGGDAVGGVGVGGGGEVEGAAGGALLLKILKEFAVVGEMGDVELDGVGEVAFKGGFALERASREC